MSGQSITIIIADRSFRLNVSSQEEEEVLREAAKRINQKLKEYAESYSFRDKQDLLAMVSLHYAVDVMDFLKKVVVDKHIEDKLVHIDKMLSVHLQEKAFFDKD